MFVACVVCEPCAGCVGCEVCVGYEPGVVQSVCGAWGACLLPTLSWWMSFVPSRFVSSLPSRPLRCTFLRQVSVSLFGQGGSKKESLIVVVANGRVDEATGEELPVHIPCTCRVQTAPRGDCVRAPSAFGVWERACSALGACVSLCTLGARPPVRVVVSLALVDACSC